MSLPRKDAPAMKAATPKEPVTEPDAADPALEPSFTTPDAAERSDAAEQEPDVPAAFLRELARAPAVVPPSCPSLRGKTLGRYRVIDRLGRGGMGTVYSAEDLVLLRPVALKVLPAHVVGDPKRRRRFLWEARLGAAAAHPNIAAVYDVEERDGHVFIAMERVEGRTLREVLVSEAKAGSDSRGLPVDEVIRIGHQVACGLDRAHEAGIVHRDLKPENIMLGPDGHVKILDFGVAKLFHDDVGDTEGPVKTGSGQILGTPCYMAPEQAKNEPIDGRADIFSLGVILYEMSTGTRPFAGRTVAEVAIAIERDVVFPPSRRNPGVLPELEQIIVRCLAKRPEDRYARCRDLAADLEQMASLARVPTSSVRVPATRAQGGAWRTKKKWRAWGLFAFAAVVCFAGAGLVSRAVGRLSAVEAPSVPAPAAAVTTLACPPLEAIGVDEPAGWLGAAAASIACRRARALLGGAPSRVIVPAALLDLPKQPQDDFPQDPFADPDARRRALEAARARAATYFDGSVRKERAGFHVHLAMKDAGGGNIGEGYGEGVALHEAVRAAMAALVHSGALPRAAVVDAEVARWSGVRDVDLLAGVVDWELALEAGVGRSNEEARLLPRKAELGPAWAYMKAASASLSGEGWDTIVAPPVEKDSPEAFARSAPVHALLNPNADVAALAEQARVLVAGEQTPFGKAKLAVAEARLLERAGENARGQALVLAALEHDSDMATWEALASLRYGQPNHYTAARAFAAWMPESPNGWNEMNISDSGSMDSSGRPTMIRRARLLSPGIPLFAVHETMTLIHLGLREEARLIAAELLSTPTQPGPVVATDARQVAGEYVLAQVEASEGRFGAAFSRSRRVLFAQKAFGRLEANDMYVLTLLMELSLLLERGHEIPDAFVRTFVTSEPHRLYPGRFVPPRVASACAYASPAAARSCFVRLRSLMASGYFREELTPGADSFIDGAEAYARGDYAAAAAAWRAVLRRPGTQGRNLLPDAFDRTGDLELAERIDKGALSTAGPFNGVDLAHLRSARRAFLRGDREHGMSLAKRVADAWAIADVRVPAVAEMRARLGRRSNASQ